jgi:hypothetical protein
LTKYHMVGNFGDVKFCGKSEKALRIVLNFMTATRLVQGCGAVQTMIYTRARSRSIFVTEPLLHWNSMR